MDRVVVAFANEEAQRRILRLLESNGCSPAGCCFSGAEVIRLIRKMGSGVVVCGFKLRDMTASDLAASLRGTAALLVVSSAVNLDYCEGETLYKLADGKVEALEFKVTEGSAVIGVPLKTLKLKPNIIISAIVRGNRTIIPGGDTEICAGDHAVVVAKTGRLKALDDIVED